MNLSEFTKFGITFKALSEEHLEMVRIWRNSDDVRLFMQYQEIINPEQQKTWFKQLDKYTNYYYIAYQNEIPFGVYNIKDIDFEIGIGEPGAYQKSKYFWEGDISMRASLSIIIFAFETLKLNTLISHVLKNNKRVLAYNQQMGFQIKDTDNDFISFELILKKEDFYANKKIVRLIKYLESN
ncbi:GNAT family N-acetyltransferase [Flavobacterium sp. HJJ]|uniref:GNAT family N-acetyltransferase n=1 Tax=Flavobacterium sp. HJJ TaxID=2783792 RepID=UPI001889D49C|nr:GNAT family N-acetyltransferase [Flavobacterium sp. HJJ]MBF4470289.1 GNAT family N-acetyltransferase [Flavobacterium sp. HJJ]